MPVMPRSAVPSATCPDDGGAVTAETAHRRVGMGAAESGGRSGQDVLGRDARRGDGDDPADGRGGGGDGGDRVVPQAEQLLRVGVEPLALLGGVDLLGGAHDELHPSSRSRERMCALIVGWVRKSRSPAREKLPRLTTAENASSCLKSNRPPPFGKVRLFIHYTKIRPKSHPLRLVFLGKVGYAIDNPDRSMIAQPGRIYHPRARDTGNRTEGRLASWRNRKNGSPK